MLLDPMEWTDDNTFTVNEHGFQFVTHSTIPDPSTGRFNVYKWRDMLDAYAQVLIDPITTMVELGVWHGGGTVLFNELLRPARLIAVDIEPVNPSPQFAEYLGSHPEVSVHWGVNQADAAMLRNLVTGPIDLVIDDASHEYDLTAASFDVLFPLLRSGGWYVIEDWGWSFVEEHAEGAYKGLRSMSDLLLDIAALTISRGHGTVARVVVRGPFLAVERGPSEIATLDVRSDHYQRSNGPHGSDRSSTERAGRAWRDVNRWLGRARTRR